ncbi:MAG: SH3 domain-containing protein [Blautia sp.]|nr:SH3 domain-containing protein [Lachnoclostridium sp.]MCM1211610.1 SH3 domain-containing protein [Blautia sp.]
MKKSISLLLIVLMLSVLFTGCGQSGSGQEQDTSADTAGTPDGSGEDAGAAEDAATSSDSSDAENADAADASSKGTGTDEDAQADVEALSDSVQARSADADDAAKGRDADADTDAAKEADEEDALPEYTVTPLDEPKIMYSTSSVNIRKGPSTDFERIGGLRLGQEVSVIGQADTGWYEVLYNETKAYVSDQYLQDEKPVVETAQETAAQPEASPQDTPAAVEPVVEVKSVAGVILVGDSRFVQMKNNVGDNPCTWIAEGGKGYQWFNENAIARIDSVVGKGSKILINLGVNDPGNLKNYLSLVNAKAEEWVGKGATVYYSSVNPVWDNPYVTEEQIEYFNAQMQGGLSANVHWIDSHGYLNAIGYKLVDGLHFNAETYQNLYAYYMSCL